MNLIFKLLNAFGSKQRQIAKLQKDVLKIQKEIQEILTDININRSRITNCNKRINKLSK